MKKHTKLTKNLKIPTTVLHVLLVAFGYGAGFATKEYIPTSIQPVPHQQMQPAQLLQNAQTPTVCFTPGKQCQLKLIQQINRAQKSIYVQAYSFTDREVSTALVEAFRRGVKVKVLLDKSNRNDNRSAKDMLISNNIPLRFDFPPGIAHNKIMVVDQSTIITGSYNFSASAYKRNTENLLIINNQPLAQQYIENWLKRWAIAKEMSEATSNGAHL